MKKLNSSFEGDLVKYYDLFFLQGRVSEEVQYIQGLLDTYGKNNAHDAFIDIGGGVGAHAVEFSKYYKHVMLLDISNDMVEYAKNYYYRDNISYLCCDVCSFRQDKKYNIATALSHVIGYQLNNLSVEKMLININHLLEKDGLFFFNFYNEPALFDGKLKSRVQKVTSNNVEITRFSNAAIAADTNCLDLDYYYIIEQFGSEPLSIEIHEKMRYFTKLELEYYLNKNGFETIRFVNYLTDNPLTSDTWNAGVLVKKVREI